MAKIQELRFELPLNPSYSADLTPANLPTNYDKHHIFEFHSILKFLKIYLICNYKQTKDFRYSEIIPKTISY